MLKTTAHPFSAKDGQGRLRVGAAVGTGEGTEARVDALVAAGSVVTRPVPPGVIVAGNPARVVRDVAPEQLLKNQSYYEG